MEQFSRSEKYSKAHDNYRRSLDRRIIYHPQISPAVDINGIERSW
ncbi:hypothetical protein QT995_25940 [Microcoleus sp. S36b_A3]